MQFDTCEQDTELSMYKRLYNIDSKQNIWILIDVSLTVKAVTLIFISGRCSAISSATQEKSGSIYNLVKNYM